MSLSPEGRRERARVGALSRSRSPDDPELVGACRALAAARLVQHMRTDADKLTAAQRQEAVIAGMAEAGWITTGKGARSLRPGPRAHEATTGR